MDAKRPLDGKPLRLAILLLLFPLPPRPIEKCAMAKNTQNQNQKQNPKQKQKQKHKQQVKAVKIWKTGFSPN